MSCLVEGISLTNLAASPHLETCFSGLSKETTDVEKHKLTKKHRISPWLLHVQSVIIWLHLYCQLWMLETTVALVSLILTASNLEQLVLISYFFSGF